MAKKNRPNPRQMLDIIRSVVEDKYIPSDQSNMVEYKTGGRIGSMRCQIDTHHEEILLCKFDQGSKNYLLFPYFQQKPGMVSMCDYLLFAEDDEELVVFSVDLKDTIDSPKQQTLLAKTFAEFILNRIKAVFWEEGFPKQVRYRQIGIKTTCRKMTTKGYDKLKYDKDDYLVLLDYHRLYTRQLMEL